MNITDFLPLNSTRSSNFSQSEASNRSFPQLPTKRSGDNLATSITVIFAILTVILNGVILTAFIRHAQLRTAFNTYVANVAVIDVIIAVNSLPRHLVIQYHGFWPYGGLTCSILLYISRAGIAANRAVHLLIAANRVWAVTFHLSYRNEHTKPLAAKTVLLSWVAVALVVTPEVILSRMAVDHSLTADDPACDYDTKHNSEYRMAFNVVVFTFREVLILVAYLFLMFILRQMRLRRIHDESARAGVDKGPALVKSPELNVKVAETAKNDVVAEGNKQPNPPEQIVIAIPGKSVIKQQHRQSERSRSYNRLFSYLVVSIICCWTPNHVFFQLASITGYWNLLFFNIQFFLTYGNSWWNPILFYVADREIRKVVNGFVKCG